MLSWRTLNLCLTLVTLLMLLAPPSAAHAQLAPENGVRLELLEEGANPQGVWFQRFKATILPGGTVSDLALVFYGDLEHSDEILQAIRRTHPSISSPAELQAGMSITLEVDPSSTAVLKKVLERDGGQVITYQYYNGISETFYRYPQAAVSHTVDFPREERLTAFSFRGQFSCGAVNLIARPDSQLVEYRYLKGASLFDAVRDVYGLTSARAAADFLRQSGWDANDWPPEEGDSALIALDPRANYEDDPVAAFDYQPQNEAAATAWLQLSERRRDAGIVHTGMEDDGFVYTVNVGGEPARASQLAELLFNTPEHKLLVARAAGLHPPLDGKGEPQPEFDPSLLGRRFQIKVPYAAEHFVVSSEGPNANGGVRILLANGTEVEQYERPANQAGLLLYERFPSDYKRLISRPGSLGLLTMDFIHFQMTNLANTDLPPERRELMAREFQSRMLWNFSRSIPREADDLAQEMHLEVGRSGATFEVLVMSRADLNWRELLAFLILYQHPWLIGMLLLALAGGAILWLAVRTRNRPVSAPQPPPGHRGPRLRPRQ